MTQRVSKHSNQPCSAIFVNFYNFLKNDVIRLCCHLSAQEIVNWVTTADGCVHTADADATKQFRPCRCRRCVLGITIHESGVIVLGLMFRDSQLTAGKHTNEQY